jgi:hypothetical protein
MARNYRHGVDAAWQTAVVEAAVRCQPGGAEGVGNGARCVLDEQRALKRQRHLLNDRPGTEFKRFAIVELAAQP